MDFGHCNLFVIWCLGFGASYLRYAPCAMLYALLHVACQAVITHFDLGMAVHTPLHRHLNPRLRGRFFALADQPVTGLALHLSEDYVTPMGEEDMVGLSVNPLPGDFLFFTIVLSDFLFLRTFCNGFFMTFQTDGQRRHSGEGLGFEIAMTCVTFQALLLMFLVIERDRLVHLKGEAKSEQKDEKKGSNDHSDNEKFHFRNLSSNRPILDFEVVGRDDDNEQTEDHKNIDDLFFPSFQFPKNLVDGFDYLLTLLS